MRTSKSFSSQVDDGDENGNNWINKESRCKTAEWGLVRPVIDLFDINNPRLQHIFNKESEELKKSFAALKKTVGEDKKGVEAFKLEVM